MHPWIVAWRFEVDGLLIDPRECRRGYPIFLGGLLLVWSFLAMTGRGELAMCLAICGVLTVGVRNGWGALISRSGALGKVATLACVASWTFLLLAATCHAGAGQPDAAIAAGAAAILLRILTSAISEELGPA